MSSPLLKIEDLHVRFYVEQGVVRALNGVDLVLDRGEAVGLVGETGCGKSLTARSITRLLPSRAARIEQGRICFDGDEILAMPEVEMRRIRGKKIAMIFQEPASSLNPVVRVGDQIMEAIGLHRPGLGRTEIMARMIESLDAVGMPDSRQVARCYPHMLSGGMQQRIMIAMAISCNPLLLIADEPTTALDVTIGAQVLEVLRKLKERTGVAILLITHDFGVVADMCDRVAVMYAGTIVETLPTSTLFRKPCHPYTKGLLESLPHQAARRSLLGVIPGTVPDLVDLPAGCAFQPRCPIASDRCLTEKPVPKRIERDHLIACHNC